MRSGPRFHHHSDRPSWVGQGSQELTKWRTGSTWKLCRTLADHQRFAGSIVGGREAPEHGPILAGQGQEGRVSGDRPNNVAGAVAIEVRRAGRTSVLGRCGSPRSESRRIHATGSRFGSEVFTGRDASHIGLPDCPSRRMMVWPSYSIRSTFPGVKPRGRSDQSEGPRLLLRSLLAPGPRARLAFQQPAFIERELVRERLTSVHGHAVGLPEPSYSVDAHAR